MMEEDCEVSRPRLQRVYTLETATQSINLTERKRGGSIQQTAPETPHQKSFHLMKTWSPQTPEVTASFNQGKRFIVSHLTVHLQLIH